MVTLIPQKNLLSDGSPILAMPARSSSSLAYRKTHLSEIESALGSQPDNACYGALERDSGT